MKVVLDANVWISALLIPVGASGRILGAALSRRIEVVVTPHLWRETLSSFSKERIQKRLIAKGRLDEAQLILFAARSRVTEVEEVAPKAAWVPGDADDDWVVQCALTAGADRIVTGDHALLGLGGVEGVEIVTARDFLAELDRES